MKKFLSCVLTFALCLSLVLSGYVDVNAATTNSVSISKTKATLYVGKTTTLKVKGTTKKVKWSTSKKSVATVSTKGKVKAKKAGKATITAKVGSKKYTCKVTVKNPSLSAKSVSLVVGKTTTLKLKGATAKSWKSSKTSVATVFKGKIKAKNVGSTTITCKDAKGKTYKCKVTVKSKEQKSDVTPTATVEEDAVSTVKPTPTTKPKATTSPKVTKKPTSTPTKKPVVTNKPTATSKPSATNKPTVTSKPTSTPTSKPQNTIAPTGAVHVHDYAVEITATCTEDGEKRCVCDCGSVITEKVKAFGHNFKTSYLVHPTCTQQGYTVEICLNCRADRKVNYTAKKEHNYELKNSIDPTCTTKGRKDYACKDCGSTYTESIGSTGHNYANPVVTKPTCTEQGYVTATCSKCGDVTKYDYVDPTGHKHSKSATNHVCGKGTTEVYTCSQCGDKYEKYIETPTEEVLVSEATCTEPAKYKTVCTGCKKTLSNYTKGKPLGHDMKVTVKNASATTGGEMLKECKRCGKTEVEYTDPLELQCFEYTLDEQEGIITLNNYIDNYDDSTYKGIKISNRYTIQNKVYNTVQVNCNFDKVEDLGYITIEKGCILKKFSFKNCRNLKTVKVSGADMSSITSLRNAFQGCTTLSNVIIENVDMSKVSTTERMFYGCTRLMSVDISSAGKCISLFSMREMFQGCTSLDYANVGIRAYSLQNMVSMFENCNRLQTVTIPYLGSNGSLLNCSRAFYGCRSLVSVASNKRVLNLIETGITNATDMFTKTSGYDFTAFKQENES